MNLINPERSSHWYHATEKGIVAYYEMRGKNGKMRAPTIADARDMNLLVSISRIASMLPKPRLEAWKQEQAIYAALTLPRLPDEPLDFFAKRVVEDMEKQGGAAREFGSRIHAQIEAELLKPSAPCPPDLTPFMTGVRIWIQENVARVIGVEQIVGDLRFGIGGKLDLQCELYPIGHPVIVDIKTQGIKNGKPEFYLDWAVQLAGYAQCVKQKGAYEIWGAYELWPQLVSVVVDSKAPGPVHVKVWENPEQHWALFLNCFEMFCAVYKYDPRSNHEHEKSIA